MASTTLNTFILPPPSFSVRTVELKGSWDNFSQSYQLKKDAQTGHWRGCHAFENIVCDGITLDVSSARDGGLRMGGTYWYFYVLHTIDGDLEYHNTAEPSTALCPLLPGQQVNVLDVPVQADLVAGRNVSSTSLDSTVFTLDPRDKYLPPGVRRASTNPATRTRKARDTPTPKITTKSNSVPLDAEAPRSSTSSRDGQSTRGRQRSLMSIFHRIRQTRSAGSNAKSSLAWPRTAFSRTGQSAKVDAENVPEVPKLPSYLSSVPTAPSCGDFALPIHRPSTARSSLASDTVAMSAPTDSASVPSLQQRVSLGDSHLTQQLVEDLLHDSNFTSPIPEPGNSFDAHTVNELEQLGIDDMRPSDCITPTSYPQPYGRTNTGSRIRAAESHAELKTAVHEPAAQAVNLNTGSREPRSEGQPRFEDESCATTYADAESSRLSYTLSENFSPGLASNTTHSGPMSPLYLSQPETPLMNGFDFEDDYDPEFLQLQRNSQSSLQLGTHMLDLIAPKQPLRAPPPPPPTQEAKPATPRPLIGGFPGYSLPTDDHASVLTIRKPPSATLKETTDSATLTPQADRQGLVHSWNDGSEHLLDDLGYLGELIV